MFQIKIKCIQNSEVLKEIKTHLCISTHRDANRCQMSENTLYLILYTILILDKHDMV